MAEKMTIDQFDAWRASCVNEPGTYTSYLRGYQDAEAELDELRDKVSRLRKLDVEAAEHVEQVIISRTSFTGDAPYVGWKGLGFALTKALDERDELRAKVARLEAPVSEDESRQAWECYTDVYGGTDGMDAALTAFLANRSNGK